MEVSGRLCSREMESTRFANQHGNVRIEVGRFLRFSICHSSLFQIWFGFATPMAKKSLKKRIDALVDALGGAQKPTLAEIRSDLVSLGVLAQELEDGQALTEKESAIAALKAENQNLKVELQTASAELEAFRAEQKQREEKERDVPDIQYRIVKELPSMHDLTDGLTMQAIHRHMNIPLDEAEIHVDKLETAGLIAWDTDQFDQRVWRRTKAGNELVVAKRLAGEEQPKQRNPDPKLSQSELIILRALVGSYAGVTIPEILPKVASGIPGATDNLILFLLVKLRQSGMAAEKDADTPRAWVERPWVITSEGLGYLVARNLL